MLLIIQDGRIVSHTGITPAFAAEVTKSRQGVHWGMVAGDNAVRLAQLRAQYGLREEPTQEELNQIGTEAYQRELSERGCDPNATEADFAKAWWLEHGNQGRFDPGTVEFLWIEDSSPEAIGIAQTGQGHVGKWDSAAYSSPCQDPDVEIVVDPAPAFSDPAALRFRLGQLVTERSAAQELDEDTTAIQAEIDRLKAEIAAAG